MVGIISDNSYCDVRFEHGLCVANHRGVSGAQARRWVRADARFFHFFLSSEEHSCDGLVQVSKHPFDMLISIERVHE